jgi:diguanylate cyclase (GGDEF)-like protein
MKNHALFAKYASNLKACRSNIEQNWQILSQNPNDQSAQNELELTIHNLAGAGTNFNCGTLSALARELCQSLKEQAVDTERHFNFIQSEIEQLLVVVDQAIEDVSQELSATSPDTIQRNDDVSRTDPTPTEQIPATQAAKTLDQAPAQTTPIMGELQQFSPNAAPEKYLHMSAHDRNKNLSTQEIARKITHKNNSIISYEQDKHALYIIEDDPLLARILFNELKHLHYEITMISDLDALDSAMAGMTESKHAIIVADVRMPDGKTTNYFIQAKEKYPNISLIFTSAIDDIRTRLAAVQAGGHYFLKKPVEPTKLIQLIDRFILSKTSDPERIIIVANQRKTGDAAAQILQSAGCEVSVLETPWRLLTAAEKMIPDIIVLSHTFTECSSEHLAQAIRQEDEFISTPILFMPDPTQTLDEQPKDCLGADGFLPSIEEPEALVAQVKSRIQLHRKLVDIITRDSLTGTYTNAAIMQRVQQDFQAAHSGDLDYALAIIDLDNLRSINEQFGHKIGDRVLCNFTHFIQKYLPTSASIGRYGGEEFLVSLPGMSTEDAFSLIDQFRQTFIEQCHIANINLSYTFSAGIAGLPAYDSVSELIYYADQALYEAQRSGQNQVQRI